MQWSTPQFDIDDGLCVRAPMDERELKKQLPLQALLEEEQGPNDPMKGTMDLEFSFPSRYFFWILYLLEMCVVMLIFLQVVISSGLQFSM